MNPPMRFRGALLASTATVFAAALLTASGTPAQAEQPTACKTDPGGITLSPGFCATVFADHLGHARHLAVASNGVVYVNTWSGRYYHDDTPPPGGLLIALQDTKHRRQGRQGGPLRTQLRGRRSRRHRHRALQGLPLRRDERSHRALRPANQRDRPDRRARDCRIGPASDRRPPDASRSRSTRRATSTWTRVRRRTPARARTACRTSPAMQPCTELETRAGTWRYDANKLDQHFSPAARFATGLRNGEGISFDSAGRIFVTQHGRDQLYQNWPSLYKPLEGQNEPAEELVQEHRGADFGWPECYYDYDQKKLVLAPEYGGDGGKTVGVCAQKQEPAAAFPAHWAPNDMLIYEGNQFPTAYKDGAFIAFHGSWNRAPGPQGGYNVVFQPLADGKASGPFVVFADGFAGRDKEPGRAAHRPTGLAVGPDGSLFIADDAGRPHLARHLPRRQQGLRDRGRGAQRLPISRPRRPAMLCRPREFIRTPAPRRCRSRPARRPSRSHWVTASSTGRQTAERALGAMVRTRRGRRWAPILRMAIGFGATAACRRSFGRSIAVCRNRRTIQARCRPRGVHSSRRPMSPRWPTTYGRSVTRTKH